MIYNIIQFKLYTINDEINQSLSELLLLSSEYHDIVIKTNNLASVKAEIAKDEALLNRFQASGLEQKRKKYECINQCIKLTGKDALSYDKYL